jgi:hypothetical protein
MERVEMEVLKLLGVPSAERIQRQRRMGVIIRNHRQESLSRAYVQAIAARSGVICSVPDLDYGVDLTFRAVDEANGFVDAGVLLDVQLKATTLATTSDLATIGFDLRVAEYDCLRRLDTPVPRILVVLELPMDEADWLAQSTTELILRRAAYWLSLRGMAATASTASVRVKLPRANLFTPAVLSELLTRIRTGSIP